MAETKIGRDIKDSNVEAIDLNFASAEIHDFISYSYRLCSMGQNCL
jgi:hypothetical protein